MASPPRSAGAGSPPYPNPLTLPQSRKRTSHGLSISSNIPNAKRRKSTLHSTVSTPGGSHPLRQTSFPPEESALDAADFRSPSVDSDITAVTGGRSVATTVNAVKGKRGRKKKAEGSIVNGKNAARTRAEGTSANGGGDDVEEEDDDEDGGEGLVKEGEEIDKATEKENLASVSSRTNCCCYKLNTGTGFWLEPSMWISWNVTRRSDGPSFTKKKLERSVLPSIMFY